MITLTDKLKDIYSRDFLLAFGRKVESAFLSFQNEKFIDSLLDYTWTSLSVRARSKKIAEKLGLFLPRNYEDALTVLFEIADSCIGFPYLFFPDFVSLYGQDEKDWELSMSALEKFTQYSSSEFAIRPFLLADSKRGINQMRIWAEHPNEHIRRLASEGCRPRLPWAESLAMYKKDPTPVISILKLLKEDSSLYVRKSVANNLNDISKDHPELILKVASDWIGKNSHTDWIIRRGCRTLVKESHPEALTLFGYKLNQASISSSVISINPTTLSISETSVIHYSLFIHQESTTRIRIEYGIDFVKSNGQTRRKKFHLSDKEIIGTTQFTGTRKHKWKNLTTRQHYPGIHQIVLLVNGLEIARSQLNLQALYNN